MIDDTDQKIIEAIIIDGHGTIDSLVYPVGLSKQAIRKRLLKIGKIIRPIKYPVEGLGVIKSHAVSLLINSLRMNHISGS